MQSWAAKCSATRELLQHAWEMKKKNLVLGSRERRGCLTEWLECVDRRLWELTLSLCDGREEERENFDQKLGVFKGKRDWREWVLGQISIHTLIFHLFFLNIMSPYLINYWLMFHFFNIFIIRFWCDFFRQIES